MLVSCLIEASSERRGALGAVNTSRELWAFSGGGLRLSSCGCGRRSARMCVWRSSLRSSWSPVWHVWYRALPISLRSGVSLYRQHEPRVASWTTCGSLPRFCASQPAFVGGPRAFGYPQERRCPRRLPSVLRPRARPSLSAGRCRPRQQPLSVLRDQCCLRGAAWCLPVAEDDSSKPYCATLINRVNRESWHPDLSCSDGGMRVRRGRALRVARDRVASCRVVVGRRGQHDA